MSDCLHLWRPKVVAARPGFDSDTPACGNRCFFGIRLHKGKDHCLTCSKKFFQCEEDPRLAPTPVRFAQANSRRRQKLTSHQPSKRPCTENSKRICLVVCAASIRLARHVPAA